MVNNDDKRTKQRLVMFVSFLGVVFTLITQNWCGAGIFAVAFIVGWMWFMASEQNSGYDEPGMYDILYAND